MLAPVFCRCSLEEDGRVDLRDADQIGTVPATSLFESLLIVRHMAVYDTVEEDLAASLNLGVVLDQQNLA